MQVSFVPAEIWPGKSRPETKKPKNNLSKQNLKKTTIEKPKNHVFNLKPWKNRSFNQLFFYFFSNYFFIVLRTNLMDANLEKIKIREQLIKDIV